MEKGLESEDRKNSSVMGEFLGYPDSAINYFNSDFEKPPLYRTERKIKELRKNKTLTREEEDLIDYVEFVPADTEKSIRRAVERGRKFRKGLENDSSQISNLFLERIKGEKYRS